MALYSFFIKPNSFSNRLEIQHTLIVIKKMLKFRQIKRKNEFIDKPLKKRNDDYDVIVTEQQNDKKIKDIIHVIKVTKETIIDDIHKQIDDLMKCIIEMEDNNENCNDVRNRITKYEEKVQSLKEKVKIAETQISMELTFMSDDLHKGLTNVLAIIGSHKILKKFHKHTKVTLSKAVRLIKMFTPDWSPKYYKPREGYWNGDLSKVRDFNDIRSSIDPLNAPYYLLYLNDHNVL